MHVYYRKKKFMTSLIHHLLDYVIYTSTYLTSSMFCINVSGHWKSGMENFLGIVYWSLQQVVKIFIFWHILVTWLTPLSYGLVMGEERSSELIHQSFLENTKVFSGENVPLLASFLSFIPFCPIVCTLTLKSQDVQVPYH